MPLPEGLSLPWKPGADFVLQLHLHPSGKPEAEQSSVGFYLTDQPPQRSMADVVLIDRKIDIPPGEPAYRTRDEFTLPVAVEVFGVFPHMHLIGREMKITAHPPEADPFSLLWIDDWDFNWQNFYQYAPPVKLPAGTRVTLEAVHDNSADNFRNPNQPPARVVWGEQTTDEMSAAILQLVPTDEAELPQLIETHRRRILGGITAGNATASLPTPVDEILRRFDRNADGKLDLEEMTAASRKPQEIVQPIAARFDRDADGALDKAELSAALTALSATGK
jgi:hypothetical protein